MPGHVLVESATFEEIDGRPKVTQKSVFETVEDLEGMLASGMEEGARETMERFTELVEELKEGATDSKLAGRKRARRGARERGPVRTRIFDARRDRAWR